MERSGAAAEPLRLLCLHGHGGHAAQVCEKLRQDFIASLASAAAGGRGPPPALECRCVEAPFPEPSRRREGRQWWRYDEGGNGNRPDDWAEMEVAATRIAEELERPARPYDGVVGFSQGAEMVHTLAVLAHRGDPRLRERRLPRFLVSLSGAVNPGHFEAASGGGPPEGCLGLPLGPRSGELRLPCLFVADFEQDGWYSAERFRSTLALYTDATLVQHGARHRVPALGREAAGLVCDFLARFQAASAS